MVKNEIGPDARAGIAHQDAGTGHPGSDAAGLVGQRRPDQVAQADVVVIEKFVNDGRGRFLRVVQGSRGGRGPDAHGPARSGVHEALAETPGVGLGPGEVVQHASAGQQERTPHGVGQGGHVGPDVAVFEEIRRADADIVGMADIQRKGRPAVHGLHEQPAHGIGRGRSGVVQPLHRHPGGNMGFQVVANDRELVVVGAVRHHQDPVLPVIGGLVGHDAGDHGRQGGGVLGGQPSDRNLGIAVAVQVAHGIVESHVFHGIAPAQGIGHAVHQGGHMVGPGRGLAQMVEIIQMAVAGQAGIDRTRRPV